MKPLWWFHPQINYFILNKAQHFAMVQLKLSEKYWRQVFPAKKSPWTTGGHRLEHSMCWWKLQTQEQDQLESGQPGQAGEHEPVHKSQDKRPRLSTGTAVSTPCFWKHTAEEQHVLSSCPSHCTVKNTQCSPTAQGSETSQIIFRLQTGQTPIPLINITTKKLRIRSYL